MNDACPSELTLSMHADRELPASAAVATELHVATCALCRAQLAGLRSEVSIVAAALAHGDEALVVPKYRRPVSRLAMVATAAGGMLVAMLVGVAPDLIGGLLQGPVGWFNPFDDVGTVTNLGVEAAFFVAKNGAEIMTSIGKAALMAAFTTFVGWFAFVRRRRGRGPLMLVALLAIVAMQPTPSQALEIRHDEKGINVPVGETIDDTLVAFGENIEIDGDVTGDVIAIGKRVSIRGRVGGQIVTGGKTVMIEGEVGGSVVGVGTETLAITSPRIVGNLYGVGSTIDVSRLANIEQNAVVAGERVQLAGAVGRDVLSAGGSVEVSGSVGRHLTAYAERIALRAPANIAGNVNANVSRADRLDTTGAVIGGELKTEIMARSEEEEDRSGGEFYLFQVLRFVAALLTGVIVLALVPGLRRIDIDRAGEAMLAGGVGLVTLIATPIIAVLVMITVIGLPIGVLGLLLWMVGIYLAKVVFAHFVGARILERDGEPRHYTIALALGLALVLVLVNLPFVGGLLNFLMTILGLGMLVLFVWRFYLERRTDAL